MSRAIVHTTDFSPESMYAFAHALRLAVALQGHLYLLHVKDPAGRDDWGSFPRVRETLAQWGLLAPGAAPAEIESRLGVKVLKVEIRHRDPAAGVAGFLGQHRADLLVLATHGREGLNRWIEGAVSEEIAAKTRIPTLFIGPRNAGFVDWATGALSLSRPLVPVAHTPQPRQVYRALADLLGPAGLDPAACHYLHIGTKAPPVAPLGMPPVPVEVRDGPIVETILAVAREQATSLIAMATEGRHGFLDTLRGSTTERVLHHAPCPVLALPIAED